MQEIGDLSELNRLPPTDTFRLAYEILGPGKRNYLGHRGGAMTEIEAAARLMGVEIGRKIQRAHDDQAKSDDRLRLVQMMLRQVRGRLTADDQKPVLEHVDKALAELTKALKIRAVEDEQDQATSQPVEVPASPVH